MKTIPTVSPLRHLLPDLETALIATLFVLLIALTGALVLVAA